MSDGQYVRFTDGSTYKIEGNTLLNYNLQDITLQTECVGTNEYIYTINYANGKKEIFDRLGNISQISDKYGNAISIFRGIPDATIISDSLGNQIKFIFDGSQNLYNITLSDGSVISYYLDDDFNVIKKVDQEGRITTYTYTTKTINLYPYSRTYNLLSGVYYNTGLVSKYVYEDGTPTALRCPQIKEISKISGDRTYLHTTYEYSGSYLNADIDYSTTVTNAEGVKTRYIFNSLHQKRKETVTFGGSVKQDIEYSYNNNNLPCFIKNLYIGEGSFRPVIEIYNYDSMGNVISYINPLSNETTFEYDNNYNMLVSKTQHKDDNTIITEEYELTEDKKSVRERNVYSNDELVQKTGYTYDQYGNAIEIDNYTDAISCETVSNIYENGAYLTSQTIGNSTVSYDYDILGRVTSKLIQMAILLVIDMMI